MAIGLRTEDGAVELHEANWCRIGSGIGPAPAEMRKVGLLQSRGPARSIRPKELGQHLAYVVRTPIGPSQSK